MTPRLIWEQPHPPNGRILAKIGCVEVGVIYTVHQGGYDWRRYPIGPGQIARGTAKTELAAKNALTGAVREFLASAGLKSAEAPA
ncbi:hypothetical protein [Paracoccus alkanivorans]|uniref:hypothetical protein n=1 Tax=Paracoccus alkanivorans TaxID=2116655 RepID=UPI00140B6336|nr:hypothetical protein [Paracoccus alkanivorans]